MAYARQSGWQAEFDLVNAARVLQWIPDAETALGAMARAVRVGGQVVVLDYDHTRAEWSRPPGAWTRFYRAFLEWREAGGLDNAIIGRVPGMCTAAGLVDIRVTPLVETVRAGDADFLRVAGAWRLAGATRGGERGGARCSAGTRPLMPFSSPPALRPSRKAL